MSHKLIFLIQIPIQGKLAIFQLILQKYKIALNRNSQDTFKIFFLKNWRQLRNSRILYVYLSGNVVNFF